MTRTHLCCLVIATMGGCPNRPNDPVASESSSTTTITSTTPPTYDRKPEVLLSSRKPDRLIVAIDFAGSKAMDRSLPLDERRRFVLEQSVAAYVAFARKELDDLPVRLMALSVPNRDDYARGDFRDMDELAVCDTDHAMARSADKTAGQRAGKVEWRAGLSH
jgi:hypothetical protein